MKKEKNRLKSHIIQYLGGRRAIVKTVSYAAMHMGIAILVAYFLSGSWQVAFAIGLVEPCVQTVAYFFHEKAWHKIETQQHAKDHHDSIINSTTPASFSLEAFLHTHHHQKDIS